MKRDSNWHQMEAHPFIARLEKRGRSLLYKIVSFFFKSKSRGEFDFKSIQKILLIKEPYRMGDLFQITPTIFALKSQYPSIHIGLVIQDRNLPVFQSNPHIDKLFLFKKREINRAPWKFLTLISQIRSQKYDAAITLETERVHLTNDLISILSGAPLRVRYDGRGLGDLDSNAFYNILIPIDSSCRHEVDRNFSVLKPFGLKLEERGLQFFTSLQENEKAQALFKDLQCKLGGSIRSKNILIHPGSYKLENRWPLKNYIEVADQLKDMGLGVLFSLGPSETEWRDEIGTRGFSITISLPLGPLGALMKLCDLVLCNDTGMMHLASGCDVKTLALFGKTDPTRWKPPQMTTVSIQSKSQDIASITKESVLSQIFRMI